MEVKITLPLLPLRDIVIFPSMVIPLFVGRDKSITALNETMKGNKKRTLLTNLENLKFKIDLQKKLIININTQLNLIVNDIEVKNKELNQLLKKQKND